MNDEAYHNRKGFGTSQEAALPRETVRVLLMSETLDQQLGVLSDRIGELVSLLEPICYPDQDDLKQPVRTAPEGSPLALALAGRIDFLTYNIAQLERLIVRINL